MCDNYSDYNDADVEYLEIEEEEENVENCTKRYEILDTTKLMELMDETIEKLNNVIPISSRSLQILLNYFKWDENQLALTFYDGDQEKLFRDAKIPNPFEEKDILILDCQEQCHICYEDFLSSELSGLGCEHKFCNDCWSQYLANRILDEGMGENITCAAYLCPILMDHKTCLSLLKNPRAVKIYKTIITNNFVATNPILRWCTGIDCTYAIKYMNFVQQHERIVCKCGAITCFPCGRTCHIPMKCNMFTKWLNKCEKDFETSKWIGENTKDCPSCKVPIEKQGGCNHMTCKSKDCLYEFCWICMGNWRMHKSSFKCNHFDKEETKAVREAQHSSRIELERFIFHYNRYMNHKKSLEFEQQLLEIVNDKIKILKKKGIPKMDMQFLTNSVVTLRHCRTTLMYTYAFAYYLKKNNQSDIFSYNQTDLQNWIETLSGYLERNIETDDYDDAKQTIGNLQAYCEDRRRVLEAHILEGYENNFWEYRDD